ncbi:hypothetical protein NC652_020805 [Populus alba x Populus x berolinensis]|nr:hypothetical protein NC652_020805 [Populus alba x Populus x berolinensis]
MANPPSPPPPQPPDPITIDGAAEDSALSSSTYLTRLELVTWRSRRYKQLAQIYRTHYWTLMEELKVKHKEYCWKYGKSPYKEDEKNKKRKRDFNNDKEIFELNAKLGIRDGGGEAEDEERGEGGLRKCLAAGFNAKAMALTSAQGRPVLCQKPVLISTVSSLCSMHFQKAERQVARALKKEGLSFSSPSKLASKLHVVVTEFVRQIQTKRRAALKENNLDVYALKLLMREKLVISLTGRSLDHWTYALEENSSCILKVCAKLPGKGEVATELLGSFQNLQASSVLDDFIFQAREWDALLVERQSNFISAGESLIMSKKHPVSAQGCLLTKAKHTASSRPSSNSPPAPQSSSSATKHPQAPPNAHQLPSNPRHRPTPFSHHHQSFKSRSPSKLQVAVSEPGIFFYQP